MKKEKRIVLGVTGSIAAYKSADIVRRLREYPVKVQVVMTAGAEEFITPLTLATLSGGKVYRKMLDKDAASWTIDHIDLAGNADLVLIAPATANIIGKIAAGIADDLLTCLAMSAKAPLLMAPAMNKSMWTNPIVRENRVKLKRNGVKFIGPVKGKLACGDSGDGRMADVDAIVNAAISLIRCKDRIKE